MNERIEILMLEATKDMPPGYYVPGVYFEMFANLIIKECINKIETYRIPVGNSSAGEMTCEWTYDALKEIRNEIHEHFGVEE